MASTTFIDNQTTIFADWLNDVNTAVYTGVFPNGSISLTTLNVTGAVTGAGFTSLINNSLSAPGAIGSATPNTGAFTTLSATTLSSTTLNTTAITGLTTPLSSTQGGTGVSAAGTSGNILTSDGTNWTSANNQYVGVGQTWQAVTRTAGVTYTNTTGKPIVLNFCSQTGVSVTIAGVTSFGGGTQVQTYIIPNGATYVLSATPNVNINELR